MKNGQGDLPASILAYNTFHNACAQVSPDRMFHSLHEDIEKQSELALMPTNCQKCAIWSQETQNLDHYITADVCDVILLHTRSVHISPAKKIKDDHYVEKLITESGKRRFTGIGWASTSFKSKYQTFILITFFSTKSSPRVTCNLHCLHHKCACHATVLGLPCRSLKMVAISRLRLKANDKCRSINK